jgi:hypothetical protein
MADLTDTVVAKPKRQQQEPKSEPTGNVAFVQPETKNKDFPVCHACGYAHKGRGTLYVETYQVTPMRYFGRQNPFLVHLRALTRSLARQSKITHARKSAVPG